MDISSLYVTPTTSYNHPLYEATTYPSHYQSEPFYINDNDAPYVSPSAQAVVMSDVSEASDPAPPIIDCTKGMSVYHSIRSDLYLASRYSWRGEDAS